MNYVRTQINLDTNTSATILMEALRNHPDEFRLESEDGKLMVSPRSILGLVYARVEWKKIYLVNLTTNGSFPSEVYQLFV